MYSGTGFDSKLKSIFKSFPDTMWIKNGTGNQCTLRNLKINAWQIKRKKHLGERGRKCVQQFCATH